VISGTGGTVTEFFPAAAHLASWTGLATGKPYEEPGAARFTRLPDPERETRRLIARLQAPGHRVTLQDAAA
jgi:hypothetical protein